jgi:hypothetical protein
MAVFPTAHLSAEVNGVSGVFALLPNGKSNPAAASDGEIAVGNAQPFTVVIPRAAARPGAGA